MSIEPGTEQDYAHVFHAGNVGDVLKHVVLAAVLETQQGGPVTYVDTHSGEALYPLRTTGEWAEGVFQLWKDPPARGVGVDPWLAIVRGLSRKPDRPERYPGSPLVAAKLLGADAKLELFETHPDARSGLERNLGSDPRVTIHATDGFAGLADVLARTPDRRVVALVDPPYVAREDWTTVVDTLVAAHRARPDAVLLLWYPIKSWSRPHVVHKGIRQSGIPAATIDLVTTPLEHKRNRLNGSGLVCVNLPDSLLDSLAAVLPMVGRRCATRNADWSLHVASWRAAS